VIRIVTKIELIGPWAMPYPSRKFRQNLFTTFSSYPTDRQTDEQTEVKTTSFSGGKYSVTCSRLSCRETSLRCWRSAFSADRFKAEVEFGDFNISGVYRCMAAKPRTRTAIIAVFNISARVMTATIVISRHVNCKQLTAYRMFVRQPINKPEKPLVGRHLHEERATRRAAAYRTPAVECNWRCDANTRTYTPTNQPTNKHDGSHYS